MSDELTKAFNILATVRSKNRPFRKPENLTAAIASELYKAFERLEAPPELLSIIGSYGDTLSDEEVLRLLKEWNQSGKILHERQ